jgi:hypothetical protein
MKRRTVRGRGAAIAVPDWRACAQALALRLGLVTWIPSPPGAQGIVKVRA